MKATTLFSAGEIQPKGMKLLLNMARDQKFDNYIFIILEKINIKNFSILTGLTLSSVMLV